MPEHRRPQNDSRQNLTDHHRLSDLLEKYSDNAACNQNDNDLQQQQSERRVNMLRHQLQKNGKPLGQILRRIRLHDCLRHPLMAFAFADDDIHQRPENQNHQRIKRETFRSFFHRRMLF